MARDLHHVDRSQFAFQDVRGMKQKQARASPDRFDDRRHHRYFGNHCLAGVPRLHVM